MPTPKLTPQLISAAIEGYEEQKKRIDIKLAELRAIQSGGAAVPKVAKPEPTKIERRTMSAEGRKAVSEATKKRWAAFHAAKQAEQTEQAEPEVVVAKVTAPKKTAVKKTPTKKSTKTATKKAVSKKKAPAAAPAETEAEA